MSQTLKWLVDMVGLKLAGIRKYGILFEQQKPYMLFREDAWKDRQKQTRGKGTDMSASLGQEDLERQ